MNITGEKKSFEGEKVLNFVTRFRKLKEKSHKGF